MRSTTATTRPIGHEKFPKFYSNRINFQTGTMSVEYLTDLTSLELK